jgi:hypothetical protein
MWTGASAHSGAQARSAARAQKRPATNSICRLRTAPARAGGSRIPGRPARDRAAHPRRARACVVRRPEEAASTCHPHAGLALVAFYKRHFRRDRRAGSACHPPRRSTGRNRQRSRHGVTTPARGSRRPLGARRGKSHRASSPPRARSAWGAGRSAAKCERGRHCDEASHPVRTITHFSALRFSRPVASADFATCDCSRRSSRRLASRNVLMQADFAAGLELGSFAAAASIGLRRAGRVVSSAHPRLRRSALDGVYVPGPDGPPEFRALPRLSTTDVADALQVTGVRILRYLESRGVITLDSDADSEVLCVSEELAERDPALAQLAVAAVSGLARAGPELGRALAARSQPSLAGLDVIGGDR